MILAAGRGARMRDLTDERPKPLLEVHGRSLIAHQIARLRAGGFDDLVINIGYHGELIRAHLGDGAAHGVRIAYSVEPPQAYGTGGGILAALPLLGDAPFLALGADVWCDFPLDHLRAAPARGDDLLHLVLVANPHHHPAGDFALDAGRLRNDGAARLTFSGIGVYRPALFAGLAPGRFELAPLLRAAADDNRASAQCHDGLWRDIGTPERLAEIAAG